MSSFIGSPGLAYLWGKIKEYISAHAGTYSKPSGGIPKSDLASAVQTSLGKADTALQSYTETDPVFAASAAHGITTTDITNWNSKTSNVGTITGITMNGASKGTSDVVDLGTVITAHQDISGKADKATTLSGYGILADANDRYFALYGGTNLNPSSSNAVDLNTILDTGSYYVSNSTTAQYVSNRPVTGNHDFRLWVIATIGTNANYKRQRYARYDNNNVYERYTTNGGTSWSTWELVQDDLANYASASSVSTLQGYFTNGIANTAYALSESRTIWGQSFNGSSDVSGNMTGVGSITANGDYVSTRTNNTATNVTVTNSKGSVGIRAAATNRGLVDVTNDAWLVGTNGTNSWMSQGNVGIGTTTPSAKLHVSGDVKISGTLSLGGQAVAVVYSGSTAPSSNTGADGDIYIQTTT